MKKKDFDTFIEEFNIVNFSNDYYGNGSVFVQQKYNLSWGQVNKILDMYNIKKLSNEEVQNIKRTNFFEKHGVKHHTQLHNKPSNNFIDITGKRFTNLVVLKRADNKPDRKESFWLCKCDCGNETVVSSSYLRSGHTKSCGCMRHNRATNFKDITNKRFGKLVAKSFSDGHWLCKCDCGREVVTYRRSLENGWTTSCGCEKYTELVGRKFNRLTVISYKNKDKYNRRIWLCKCDCGNICECSESSLIHGTKKSCGCFAKERAAEQARENAKNRVENMAGQVYGKLTVIKFDTETYMCECECECGGKITYSRNYLRRGYATNCGCERKKSCGEDKIETLLKESGIKYISEKTFVGCQYDKNNGRTKARFDFYINDSFIIEFDGIQHFEYSPFIHKDIKEFEIGKKRDIFKTNWCKENNIPLIRIPYWKYDTLCIEDLMLETTEFRVV